MVCQKSIGTICNVATAEYFQWQVHRSSASLASSLCWGEQFKGFNHFGMATATNTRNREPPTDVNKNVSNINPVIITGCDKPQYVEHQS